MKRRLELGACWRSFRRTEVAPAPASEPPLTQPDEHVEGEDYPSDVEADWRLGVERNENACPRCNQRDAH